MPNLWKKAKIANVSGFISDLRSSKFRSSLLVQTGFPTSLADLIVKNRIRLKKPSSKKGKKAISGVDCSPPTTAASALPPRYQITSSSQSQAPALELPFNDVCRSEIGGEFRELGVSYSGSEEISSHLDSGEFRDVGVSGSGCFPAIVKVFFVVILALGTKNVAVGITASAFVLFFIEFVGKRLSFCSRDSTGGLDLSRGVRVREEVDLVRVNESELASFDCKSNEIQVIESDLDSFKGKERSEYSRLEWKREVLAMGDDGDLIKVKKVRNPKLGNAILKEKFLKKFVLKKFRGPKSRKISKEGKSDSGNEASEFKGGGVGEKEEKEEEEDVEEENGQVDEYEEVCSSVISNETSLVNLEGMAVTREYMCTEINRNTGHLVFLVIVLFGLVGGRVMALLLTVTWILLVRLVETAWGNMKKMYESRTLL